MIHREQEHFDPDVIGEKLQDLPLIRELHVYESISSTNHVARRLAEAGAPSLTLVLADFQKTGRGRFGRHWDSPKGVGLWFSLIIRLHPLAGDWHLLPMLLSETVATALTSIFQKRFRVKWPNDVLCEGKKVCGVLCEASSSEANLQYVVAGIGVNVNQTVTQFPEEIRTRAASLRLLTGERVDRVDLLVQLLAAIVERLHAVVSENQPIRLSSWRHLCGDLGADVTIRSGGKEVRGIFRDVSEKGEMIVDGVDRQIYVLPYGEATFVREEAR